MADSLLVSGIRSATMEVFPAISMDPRIRFGKPCLAGTLLDVAIVLFELASGPSVERVAQTMD
jgi:uncharacterized protein (DUF433 family)